MSKTAYIVTNKLCSLSKFQCAHCLHRVAAHSKTLSAHDRGARNYGILFSERLPHKKFEKLRSKKTPMIQKLHYTTKTACF